VYKDLEVHRSALAKAVVVGYEGLFSLVVVVRRRPRVHGNRKADANACIVNISRLAKTRPRPFSSPNPSASRGGEKSLLL